MSRNFEASLSIVNVQVVPNTPPLNKFGGAFENGWEYFFDDLNSHLQQMQSVYATNNSNLFVNRNGSIATVSGYFTKTRVNVGVRPVSAMTFYNGAIQVTEDGYAFVIPGYSGTSISTSITFIAKD